MPTLGHPQAQAAATVRLPPPLISSTDQVRACTWRILVLDFLRFRSPQLTGTNKKWHMLPSGHVPYAIMQSFKYVLGSLC